MNNCYIKISELSDLSRMSTSFISRHFKNAPDSLVVRSNSRVVGINPEATEDYLKLVGITHFTRPAILLSANLCGGVGKTTSIYNLGSSLRRITSRSAPIIYVDGDSQGSFTSAVFGEPADEKEPILIHFLERKADIDDILTEVGDNIWFVKSNLNQSLIDKVLNKPSEIKNGMLRFYNSIFNKFGNETKIFQDHTPQLSCLLQSSVCALSQIDNSVLKAILIPMRGDKFAIQGAEYVLNEIGLLRDTFSFKESLDIHCFFSSIDKRVSTTAEAIKLVGKKDKIINHLAPNAIRYCSEVTKSVMKMGNVYSNKRRNNAAEDYQQLLNYIFSYNLTEEGATG